MTIDNRSEPIDPNQSLVPKMLNVKRNFFQRIIDRLWGYDFFISYQWSTGGQYAVNLAQRLRSLHYDVFLDRSDYATGDDWKAVGQIALKNTQRLVLIATKGAVCDSKPVEHEVEIFTRRGRRVIPIVFGDELIGLDRSQFATLSRMTDSQLYITGDVRHLNLSPSDETINRLIQTHQVLRRRNLRAILTAIPVIAVIVFGVWSYISYNKAIWARDEAKTARDDETQAKQTAQKQQADANRENADFYWRFAVEARDTNDHIKASLLFLRGANSLDTIVTERKSIADKERIANYDFAASVGDQRIIQSWVHAGPVIGCKFNRDESRVLTWSGDVTARLWDVTKPEPLQTFRHTENKSVTGVQFSRDESRVLTWSDDGTARLWDVTKPEPLYTFNHQNSVNGAQFSRDELRVLTWSDDGTARLWDLTKPELLQTFNHQNSVKGAQFSRDESRVLTWSGDGTARLWDAKPEPLQMFKHETIVNGAQFSRDETCVLTWSGDGTARLWDVTKPEPLQTFKHGDGVFGAQFNGDESRVLTWSGDGTVRLWDVTKPEPLQTFKHAQSFFGVQFSRNESHVLTWNLDSKARLWDVTKSEPLQTFNHEQTVNGAQFSHDESRVLTWSRDGTARLWRTSDPLSSLSPKQRICELEFRTGMTLDENQNLKTLKYDEWQARLKSDEYREITKKLGDRFPISGILFQ